MTTAAQRRTGHRNLWRPLRWRVIVSSLLEFFWNRKVRETAEARWMEEDAMWIMVVFFRKVMSWRVRHFVRRWWDPGSDVYSHDRQAKNHAAGIKSASAALAVD